MDPNIPHAKSSRPGEREKLQRMIASRGLGGLANDTKWNELIDAIRANEWRPSYRYKCIDGLASRWDVEWFYHLPFPMLSVEWLDIGYLHEFVEHRLPPRIHVTDHSVWMEPLLRQIGLEFEKGGNFFRIFGYSPKNYDLFEPA